MFDLNKLYAGSNMAGGDPRCEGCSILCKDKAVHSHMDHEDMEQCDTLFLSDSLSFIHGSPVAFNRKEMSLLQDTFPAKFVTAASVKCTEVKEADMKTDDIKICRQHIQSTIDTIKPRLVFACGNLAMKMILRKSGITNKRGKAFEFESEEGHKCTVVPVFHPYACIKEPKNLSLFQTDVKNAYEMYILNRRREGDFKYKAIMNIDDLYDLTEKLKISFDTLAVDTETTGLNFRTDSIMTLSISSRDMTWVIPLDHKDSPFKKGTDDYADAWFCIRAIMSNPNNKKVFHNAKFDLKFLLSYGITVENVWDTKIMHHLLDENMPKSLMDLTKLYFASELENL